MAPQLQTVMREEKDWVDILPPSIKRAFLWLSFRTTKFHLVLLGICIYLFIGFYGRASKPQKLKIFHVTPRSSEDNIQLMEYMRRKKRVREVCDKYGAFSSKVKFLAKKRKAYKEENLTPQDLTHRLDEDTKLWSAVKISNKNQLIIQRNYHLGWCKVPKAASTSWSWIYLKLGNVPDAKINSSTRQHALLREVYPPMTEFQQKKFLPFCLKFMVVRHPFERLLSAYRDKLEDFERDLKMRDGYYNVFFGKDIMKKYRTGHDPELAQRKSPTFEEFVKYLINDDPKAFDEHWKPISYLCSPCHTVFDIISKMETLVTDIDFIFGQTKIPLSLPWAHKTNSSNSDTISDYFSRVTRSDILGLKRTYLLDLEMFDYSIDKYYDVAIDDGAVIDEDFADTSDVEEELLTDSDIQDYIVLNENEDTV